MVARLAIVGTGLIGASVALAARRAGVESVRGFDPDPGALEEAVRHGAVEPASSLAEAVAHEAGDGGEVVIAEVLRSGYRWNGRTLRPAMVRTRD